MVHLSPIGRVIPSQTLIDPVIKRLLYQIVIKGVIAEIQRLVMDPWYRVIPTLNCLRFAGPLTDISSRWPN